mmetsp:Transcript_24406/g.34129  ORF Transcript_24406/g.34129 Transcript_24406/m.34129 type:complete len:226 (+) Transcript_24406:446-1123(+)|eukprot:CAMPEP_0185279486 /NCGR_PEP_ID=MMETSP1359-20130426/63686_1 /TAXON_ID=552665 /ORGANISM="Bigelowiella longifila, Strain CCMP242" /LENGTH=225 /DNA_ID=CAMNT_0027874385 /DNA_START=444 /DNA_END=1121 /DNA_ORIENTATION=-
MLMLATVNIKIDLVKMLVEEYGAKVDIQNSKGDSALDMVRKDKKPGHKQLVDYLYAKAPEAEKERHKAALVNNLRGWAGYGKIDEVHELVASLKALGTSIDTMYNDENALMRAAENNELECVRVLVETYNANLEAKNKRGMRALEIASKWRRCKEVAAYLLTKMPKERERREQEKKKQEAERLRNIEQKKAWAEQKKIEDEEQKRKAQEEEKAREAAAAGCCSVS